MYRFFVVVFLVMFAFVGGSNAASSSGTLTNNSSHVAGFDWRYPWAKTDAVKRIQSQFIWSVKPTSIEHGIVAYTVGGQVGYLNSPGMDLLWSYGVGAYVMQSGAANSPNGGLAIEVWGPAQYAYIWDQDGSRSIGYPSNGTRLTVISLDQAKSGLWSSYISSNPGFVLQDGYSAAYWVRLTLTRMSGGWLDVFAELYTNSTLVQMARMQVIEASWLPSSLNGVPQTPRGTVARGQASPGAPVLYFNAFDSF